MLKAPVWTWEVPVYFFVGGLAGMSAVIAAAAEATGGPARLVAAAMLVAAAGAAVSTVLLVTDLGRPARFLHMLRVLKLRSPMSVGAWTLALFGTLAGAGAALAVVRLAADGGGPGGLAAALVLPLAVAAAVPGAVLATYTGVLLGATVIPAWRSHRGLLPVHFGLAGLGAAAATLELLGFRIPALHALGLGVAAAETGVGALFELRTRGAADRALRTGRSGLLLRASGVLAGPGALALRLMGLVPAAAAAFLVGALVSRFGWLEAGRASALDPEAALVGGSGASRGVPGTGDGARTGDAARTGGGP